MNNIASKFQRLIRHHRKAIQNMLNQKKVVMFLSLGMLALGIQGSSLGYAQEVTTNASANAPPTTNSSSATSSALNPPGAPSDNTPPTLKEAAVFYGQGKSDDALRTVNAVIQLAPTSVNAYIFRGAIYSGKQVWDQAQKDYQTALQMDPKNDGIRYDLADLKFKQKQFDAARSEFLPLQDNSDFEISDLIRYKIFLCDLLAGHDDVATRELDVFNQVGAKPSYYFGNAAWDLVHKKPDEAKGWLVSANHIYPGRKQLLYASILKEMGYLPLPPSSEAK